MSTNEEEKRVSSAEKGVSAGEGAHGVLPEEKGIRSGEEGITPEEKNISPEETMIFTERKQFTFDSLGKISLLVFLCVGVCVALILLYLVLFPIRHPKSVYFSATEAGQLIQDVPLNKPNLALNVLLNWVTENMMTIHTFNFVNYATVIDKGREYFTNDGYDSYLMALKNNNILDSVINNKYVIRAVPENAPQITKEGVLANFYLWKIKLPMTFRYRNVDTDKSEDVEITLLIVRVPTTEAPYGIKILKYELAYKS